MGNEKNKGAPKGRVKDRSFEKSGDTKKTNKKNMNRKFNKDNHNTSKPQNPKGKSKNPLHYSNLDPFYDRESQKYPNPIPSREYIISVLEKSPTPLNEYELFTSLSMDRGQESLLAYRLSAMVRDHDILTSTDFKHESKYFVISSDAILEGVVQMNPMGKLLVKPNQYDVSYHILPSATLPNLLPGDKVHFKVNKSHHGELLCDVIDVISTKEVCFRARVVSENGLFYLKSIEPNVLFKKIPILPQQMSDFILDDIYIIHASRDEGSKEVEFVVKEKLSDARPAMNEVMDAIAEFDLPYIFPNGVIAQIAKMSEEVEPSAKKGRIDITHLPLVTIDGEDAKDFDDAVYCEEEEDGFRLIVAIADVSYYVKPKTELDKEAFNRGTSVYFPGSVIPMLPEKLSNGLCSLKPNVDRLCMVCDLSISLTGKVKTFEFYEAVMNSKARLTYTIVSNYIENKEPMPGFEALHSQIDSLYKLYNHLLFQRKERGAIEFDSLESIVEFDEENQVKTIKPIHRRVAHRIIEECMLCANVASAKFLSKNQQVALYRVHKGPTDEKLIDLRIYLTELGLKIGQKGKPTPKDYNDLIMQIQDRGDKNIIETILLRSLSQAVYSPNNEGHFGLAYKAYTHFTSPIRRYPDLLVHRGIKSILSQKISAHEGPELEKYEMFGAHCSMTERRADDASRDVISTLKCYFMQNKIGQVFPGFISSVTHFGVFIQLSEFNVDGLIHISKLGVEYYEYDQMSHTLVGRDSGDMISIGDKVKVKVKRVDPEQKQIDFELVSRMPSLVKPNKSELDLKRRSKTEQNFKSKSKGRTKEHAPSHHYDDENPGTKKKSSKKRALKQKLE